MILKFNEKNLNMIFEISEDKKLYLLDFSNTEDVISVSEMEKKYFPAVEIHITGRNQDDHHGSKYTVTSGTLSLKYENYNYFENADGKKLEFYLKDDSISAVLHYQFYSGISCVRSWVDIKNISNENIGIEYVSSFTLTGIDKGITEKSEDKINMYIPHNSWMREFNWRKNTLCELGYDKTFRFSTQKISASNAGTWSSKEYLPMGMIENTQTATNIMWQIESNCSWQWEVSDIKDHLYLKMSGPNERDHHWYKELKPEEEFSSIRAAVVVGNDLNSAIEEMTLYRRRIVRENKSDKHLPVIFNDYMNCLNAEPTTEKELPVIDKAAEFGAEYYCMDAGWYSEGMWWYTVGEWEPAKWRFPNGINEVFDYVRKKGMIPGIWLEIESMGIDCPLAKEFPDECFFMRHGKRVIDHGRYQFDFRNKLVRDYATSVIDRVVNEYGVGYIKLDYNIDAGIGTEVDSDSFGDGLLKYSQAYRGWTKEIMDKYPDLIIENCSSGGMRMDYKQLSIHSLQSVSDQPNYKYNAVIASNCATGVLPEQAAVWSYPIAAGDENEAVVNMVNAMMGRIHLSGDVCNLSQKQMSYVKEGVECYKKIRNDIKTAIPFYPLGLNMQNGDFAVSGYKNQNSGYILVWKFDTDKQSVKIPLSNSGAEVIYPLDSTAKAFVDTNEIEVAIPDKYQAVVLKYNGINNNK